MQQQSRKAARARFLERRRATGQVMPCGDAAQACAQAPAADSKATFMVIIKL